MGQSTPPQTQPRIDHLVGAVGGDRQLRRTEYTGTVWIGGPPPMGSVQVSYPVSPSRPEFATFIVPDSLPYLNEGPVIAARVWLLGGGGDRNAYILRHGAMLVPDQQGRPYFWLQLSIHVAGTVPVGAGYEIVVLAETDAVPPPG
jgi:hypothetical protein